MIASYKEITLLSTSIITASLAVITDPSVLLAPGILLSGLIAFQLFEAFTCFKSQSSEKQKNYKWGIVFLKKGGTWMLWVGFLWLDGIAKTIPGLLSDRSLPILGSPYVFPITTGFTILAGAAEYYRYATNINSIQGPQSDAVWALRLFKVVTAGGIQKWLQAGNSGIMTARLTDHLEISDFEAAIKYYKEGGEPPEWLRQIAPDHVPTLEELEHLELPTSISPPPSGGT